MSETAINVLPDNFGFDLSGTLPGATNGKEYRDQVTTWQKENPFVPKEHRWGTNWTKEEYDKHLGEIHDKYPGLTQLFLHGGPNQNANLSTHEDTDKYARLADAYNAQYRYVPGQFNGGSIFSGGGHYTPGRYEAVTKMDTQDLKQAEQLRTAQGDLRKYGLDNEAHYQQAYLKQKMDEAMALTNQGYKEAFFNANEEMRRTGELFDLFKEMRKEDFLEVMKKYRMPAAKASKLYAMIKEDRLFEGMLFWEQAGGTKQSADQIALAIEGGNIVKDLVNNKKSFAEVQDALGQMKGQALIGQIQGIYNAAMSNSGALNAETKKLAATLKLALGKVAKIGATAVKNAEVIAAAAAISWILGQAMGFVGPIAATAVGGPAAGAAAGAAAAGGR